MLCDYKYMWMIFFNHHVMGYIKIPADCIICYHSNKAHRKDIDWQTLLIIYYSSQIFQVGYILFYKISYSGFKVGNHPLMHI